MDCIMHDFERSLCEARRAQHAAYRQAFERSPIDPAQHVIYSQQLYHKLRAKLKRAALRAERHPDTYPRLYRTMRKCSAIALKAAKDAEMACMVAQMRMLSARTHADLLQAAPAEGNGFPQVHDRMNADPFQGSSTSSSSYRAHFYVRRTNGAVPNTSAFSNTTAVSYRHNRRIPRNLHVTETFVIQDEDAESAQPQQQTAQHRADAAAAAIAVAQAVVAEQQRPPAAQPQPSAQAQPRPAAQPQPSAQGEPHPAAHTQEDPTLGELFVSSRFFDALCFTLYSVFTMCILFPLLFLQT